MEEIDMTTNEELDEFEDDEVDEEENSQMHAVYAVAPIQTCTQTFATGEPTLLNEASSTPSPTPPRTRRRVGDEEDDEEEEDEEKSFATPPSDPPSTNSNSSQGSPLLNHQKRFLQLQAFLRLCDEGDQKELLQALRSLSAAARSGHAFNLEYRALLLSMEEGREMVRLKMLNVMGRKDQTSSTPGSTPEGSRLPAPGSNPIDISD